MEAKKIRTADHLIDSYDVTFGIQIIHCQVLIEKVKMWRTFPMCGYHFFFGKQGFAK